MKDNNLIGKLDPETLRSEQAALRNISPDDAKYRKITSKVADYLSADAEWHGYVAVQKALLETRVEFGKASIDDIVKFEHAEKKFSSLNASLLEDHPDLRHDQLAVLEELGRNSDENLKGLLHPGTTSYDIVDTARAYLAKKAWKEIIRPEISKTILKLSELSEKYLDADIEAFKMHGTMRFLQVGRTHLQNTSPVPFATTLALYAARLAGRVERCDIYFDDLRGKVSGIVGTGASIDAVIGDGKSIEFESAALAKLGLRPDYTATQITAKERLSDVGHGLTTLMRVLQDFSNDIRMMYSSAIGEVTSRDNAERLGGSSADAMKNNPIDHENICGKAVVVESGMRVLYEMIVSDFQRDLRNSVMGRYQPQEMMTESYEAFSRLNKTLSKLSVNEDRMQENLQPVRDNPSEAMVAILRSQPQWIHPIYGVGHDFVKEMGKIAKKEHKKLLDVALADAEFKGLYDTLPEDHKNVLNGRLEFYIGSAHDRARHNIGYAKDIAARPF